MKTGKWMYFIDGNDIDRVWSKIVKALADGDGPLAKTGVVSTAKVAASPNGRGGYISSFSLSETYCQIGLAETIIAWRTDPT